MSLEVTNVKNNLLDFVNLITETFENDHSGASALKSRLIRFFRPDHRDILKFKSALLTLKNQGIENPDPESLHDIDLFEKYYSNYTVDSEFEETLEKHFSRFAIFNYDSHQEYFKQDEVKEEKNVRINRFFDSYINPFLSANIKQADFHDSIDHIVNEYLDFYVETKRQEFGYSYDKLIDIIDNPEYSDKIFEDFGFKSFNLVNNYSSEDIRNLMKEDEDKENNSLFIGSYYDKDSQTTYHLLKDTSFLIENDDEFSPMHPFQEDFFVGRLKFLSAQLAFKKSPSFFKNIVCKLGDEHYGFYNRNSFEQSLNLQTLLETEKNLIKQVRIPVIDIFNKKHSIEDVVDVISEVKHHNDAKQKMKSFLSSKTMYLLTPENINIFKKFDNLKNRLKITRDQLNDQVFNSISHYVLEDENDEKEKQLKQESFHHSLVMFKNKALSGFDKNYYINLMKENNHLGNIIYSHQDVMIYKVSQAKESLLYGNNSWCISRKSSYKTYFKKYKTSNKSQYFYYDFASEKDSEMMIGITTKKDGTPTDAFDNSNRGYMNGSKLNDIIELIKKKDPEIALENQNKKKTLKAK